MAFYFSRLCTHNRYVPGLALRKTIDRNGVSIHSHPHRNGNEYTNPIPIICPQPNDNTQFNQYAGAIPQPAAQLAARCDCISYTHSNPHNYDYLDAYLHGLTLPE